MNETMRPERVQEIRATLTLKQNPAMSFVMGLSMLHREVLRGTKIIVLDQSYGGAFGVCDMIFQDLRTGKKYKYHLSTIEEK